MEKTTRTERITLALKKHIALLTQIGVIVSMLVGALVWVNAQLDLSGKFADRVARQASDRVVEELDPLTREEYYGYEDSLALSYNAMALALMARMEDRMNLQDSLLHVVLGHGARLEAIDRVVRMNGLAIDTLTVQHSASREAVIAEIVQRYRDDSLHTYINKLQSEYRFSKLMEAVRQKNREVLDEIRNDGKHGKTIFKKRRRPRNRFE